MFLDPTVKPGKDHCGRLGVRPETGVWHLPDELASHAGGAGDLTRLCTLMASGRLDGQIELEASWRQPSRALDALVQRRVGGKAVLHVDRPGNPGQRKVRGVSTVRMTVPAFEHRPIRILGSIASSSPRRRQLT
jgi:hypothetical protein